jgi:ribosomal protein S18 acetylase RimI-like enzyme
MTESVMLALGRKSSPRVRRASRSDIEKLAGIEALVFASDRLSRRSLTAFVTAPTAALLVAEISGIAGYALVLFRSNSRAARLYSLAVEPRSTGGGIGSRLLAAAEAAARDRGAETLRLEVRADNMDAVRFYSRHGYALFARRENYYADGMAALRLARPLNVRRTTSASASHRAPLESATDG